MLFRSLRYEEEAYEELISKSPKVGSSVITAYGTGTVVSNNLLRQTVKIKMDDDRDEAFRTLKITELGEEAVKAAQFAKKIQEEKAQRTFEQYTFENTETNEIDTPLNFNEDDNGDAGSKERRDKEHGTRSRQASPNRGKKSDFTKKKNYPRKKNTFKNKSGQGSVPDKIEGNTVREKSGDKQSAGGRKKKNFKGSYHKNRKNDKAKPSF